MTTALQRTDTAEIVIVGVGESEQGVLPGRSALELQSDALAAALEDSGLLKDEIDGVFCTGLPRYSAVVAAEYHGLKPRHIDSTEAGGTSAQLYVGHAVAAIRANLCTTAVILYGSTQRSSGTRHIGGAVAPGMPQAEFEAPSNPLLPISAYALVAQRHMYEFGTKPQQLAQIAVSTREWARLNSWAYRQEPLSIDDVLSSPLVSSPLHRDEICVVTDGAGAVILTTAQRGRSLRQKPIHVLGHGEALSHFSISQMPDLTRTAAAESGARAFSMAGLRPEEMDLAEIYDSFTITVLLSLEDLGFCAKGDGGAFVEGGRLGPGGSLPTNTQGGGLSYTHPGMLGVFLLIEATRQLRGELGERQVPNAKLGVVHGTGGVLSVHGTVVLGTD